MADQFMVPLYHLELVREKNIPYQLADKVEAAAEVFHEMLDSSNVEKLATIHCNSGLQMIGAEIVAIGGMEHVGAAMADLFRGAIHNNAAVIWIAHNHVDGVVEASLPDYRYTRAAMEAGFLLGVNVRDHLVIGPGAHYSILSNRRKLDAALQTLESEQMMKRLTGMIPVPNKFPYL